MKNPLYGVVLVGVLSLAAYSLCFNVATAATEVNGEILDGTVWTSAENPYVVTNGYISVGSTLTIEPGVVVKFPPEHGLSVDGSLIAQGTETEKIYFTSLKDDEVGGDTNGDGATTTPNQNDWQQIRIFETGSASLTHAVIRYGGMRNPLVGLSFCGSGIRSCQGAITNLGSLELIDSELAHNADYGVFQVMGVSTITRSTLRDTSNGFNLLAQGGEVTIESSTISGASDSGLVFDEGTTRVVLNSNSFADNDKRDVLIYAKVDFSHANNVSSSGSGQGIYIGGVIDADTTWTKDSMPYVIERDVAVPVGQTLTINPGVVVKFSPASALVAEGTLIARGTEVEKIYFTSIKDDEVGGDTNGNGDATSPTSGDWQQIRVLDPGVANFSHVVLRYGGKPYRPGVANCAPGIGWCEGVISSTGVVSMSDAELRQNRDYGIYQTLGSSTIERTIIENATAIAVRVDAGTTVIHQSSLANNAHGLDVDTDATADAKDNWWGSDTGPFHTTLNAAGTGVRVSGNVDFTPWLQKDPFAPEEPLDPLILKYEPILYFHPDEDYYPMNVEAFVEASALWSADGVNDTLLIPRGEVTTSAISGPDTENWYLAFSADGPKEFSTSTAKARYDQLKDEGKAVPTYYAHKMEQDGWIVLQYWYFYAFNNWAEHGGRNNHEGDWESVFVFLDAKTKKPKYVAYSSHLNDGDKNFITQYDSVRRVWADGEIEMENDKAKSFVALGSHANYSNNGEDGGHQIQFSPDDETSISGNRLDTWLNKKIISNETPWLSYAGKWGADRENMTGGEDGPRGPKFLAPFLGGGVIRFQEPVEWAGLDKIAKETTTEPVNFFSFPNQLTTMSFAVPVAVGTSIVSDQHDELITFGNLDEVMLLPHFWDFESNLVNDTFNTLVTLGYNESEVSEMGLAENDLSVFLYDEDENMWGKISATIDSLANTISFPTTHFSRYAIGAVPEPNTPPTISLVGSSTIKIVEDATFVDPGAVATDSEDGNLTTQIVVSGLVNIEIPGAYKLVYSITDSGNLTATTSREVIVTKRPATATELLEDFKVAVNDTNLKAAAKRDLKKTATLVQTLIARRQKPLAKITVLVMEVAIKLEQLQKKISKTDAKTLLNILIDIQRKL